MMPSKPLAKSRPLRCLALLSSRGAPRRGRARALRSAEYCRAGPAMCGCPDPPPTEKRGGGPTPRLRWICVGRPPPGEQQHPRAVSPAPPQAPLPPPPALGLQAQGPNTGQDPRFASWAKGTKGRRPLTSLCTLVLRESQWQGCLRAAENQRRCPRHPPPPPVLQTQVTIVGETKKNRKKKFTVGKILSGHFRYTNFWVPGPPPPSSLLIHLCPVGSEAHPPPRARNV